jgi:hypothetical protein
MTLANDLSIDNERYVVYVASVPNEQIDVVSFDNKFGQRDRSDGGFATMKRVREPFAVEADEITPALFLKRPGYRASSKRTARDRPIRRKCFKLEIRDEDVPGLSGRLRGGLLGDRLRHNQPEESNER